MRYRPRLIVFASGKKAGGGSGFENLVQAKKTGALDAEIVAVVCNHEKGEVRERAERLGVPFIHFDPSPQHPHIPKYMSMSYKDVVEKSGADWAALSGWLKLVKGLDPRKTFNIHPALLSQLNGRFGGHGMYGRKVHEAVKQALDAGEITESGFTMHFVTDEMDGGEIFFEHRVPLKKGMSVADIEKVIRKAEHEWQPRITNMVVRGEIRWDGKDPKTLVVPRNI